MNHYSTEMNFHHHRTNLILYQSENDMTRTKQIQFFLSKKIILDHEILINPGYFLVEGRLLLCLL